MSRDAAANVVSINVGSVREVTYRGKPRTTAIFKEPVPGPVRIGDAGVDGDHQADPVFHGGPRKAVYAYSVEDAAWWSAKLGTPVPPGTFGENLTLGGLPVNDAVIGERWRVGTAVVEVTQPRFPCWKLGYRMGDGRFPRRFLLGERAGTYLGVVEPGSVAVGDPIELLSRPGHRLTIGLVAHLNHADRQLALLLLEAAEAGVELDELSDLIAGVA
ncbi:MAG TPA: MOSC domain-containing protein [Actinomycetota bacterium]|nr:MOSC domain-containing protein [Actinomycetota bacterium]